MLECILEVPKNLILAGWCKVDHQSTENLTIGTFIKPIIAIIELTFIALLLLSKILQDKIYIK